MSEDNFSVVRRQEVPATLDAGLVSPMHLSVAYCAADPDMLDEQYDGQEAGFTYAREGHPNGAALAAKIDRLEAASGGVVTGSGMSALAAIYLALLRSGDHILASNQLYGRNLRLLQQDLGRLGMDITLADPTDGAAFADAMRPNTRLIILETVSNPTLRIADIDGIAQHARDTNCLVVIDNTFTTPAAFRPFEHGADIVMHSVTKLLAGHSDVTLGYVAARDPGIGAEIRDAVATWGLTPSPFDCWLAERGLHSFALRHERAEANAAALADHLATNPNVDAVFYPTRPDHPDHARAVQLLGPHGGNMFSFRLAGGREVANRFVRGAKHIPFAPTLGDIATTISHPATSSHRGLTEAERLALGITEGFFRISTGIEDITLLKREFDDAIRSTII